LSSGSRIVVPSDDSAGVGRAEKLSAQNKRVQAAMTNVQNATSFAQTSDGFMSKMSDMLSRLSELSRYASDVMKNPSDLALYQSEFSSLQQQLRQTIGGSTSEIGGTTGVAKPLGMFNGNTLFGANPGGMTIATGPSPGDNITIPETNLRDGAMNQIINQDSSGNFTLSVTDPTAVQKITDAIDDLAGERANLGGVQSRLQLAASTLTVEGENLTSAISRIQDVDVAEESTRLSKYNILNQSGAAMLSQANQAPQAVLKLLQSLS
jgi:flagellin